MSPAELLKREQEHGIQYFYRRPAPKPDLRSTIEQRTRTIRTNGRQIFVQPISWLGGELFVDPTRNEGVYTLDRNLPGDRIEAYLTAVNAWFGHVSCENFILEAMARSYEAHAAEMIKIIGSAIDPKSKDQVFAAEGYWKIRPFQRFLTLQQTVFFSVRRCFGALNAEGECSKNPEDNYRKSPGNESFKIFHQIIKLT